MVLKVFTSAKTKIYGEGIRRPGHVQAYMGKH